MVVQHQRCRRKRKPNRGFDQLNTCILGSTKGGSRPTHVKQSRLSPFPYQLNLQLRSERFRPRVGRAFRTVHGQHQSKQTKSAPRSPSPSLTPQRPADPLLEAAQCFLEYPAEKFLAFCLRLPCRPLMSHASFMN